MTAVIDDLVGSSDCLVVVNPAAGSCRPHIVDAAVAHLAGRARSVRTVLTRGAGRASDVVHPDARLVVVVGGDGTVNEVVQGMHAEQILCVLPAGSGNSTARNLVGDRTWRDVLDLLDRPGEMTVRDVDLLRIREAQTLAVLGVATGFLAQVLVDARRVDPDLRGIDRYFAAAAGVLADMPRHPTRVTVDGVVLSDGPASSVAVGGGRYRARDFQFLPRSLLDDGLLDVSSIAALDAGAVGELLALIPDGRHIGRPGVHYGRGRTVVIERTDGLPLVAEFDGTVWDGAGSRITVDVLPKALRAVGASDRTGTP